MSRQSDSIGFVVNWESDRLAAVSVARGVLAGTGRRVVGWTVVERPSGLDDPGAVAAWIGEVLRQLGRRRGLVTLTIPRSEVVIKRLGFPAGATEADLPGMVRLQMLRQVTVGAEDPAIDFVSMPSGADLSVAVLAAAVQRDRVDQRVALLKDSGHRVGRATLKASGAAVMIADLSRRRGGAVLGITIGCGTTEFVIVEEGRLAFARATDLIRPTVRDEAGGLQSSEDLAVFASKVAVECKRTWMTYRVSPPPEAGEVVCIAILGDDALCREVSQRCEEAMQIPSLTLDGHELATFPEEMGASDRAAVLPLLGVDAEPEVVGTGMDFVHPRKEPDASARLRQRLLAGLAAAIVLGGTGWTVLNSWLNDAVEARDAARTAFDAQTDDYNEGVRERARLEHIKHWTGAGPDFLAHLAQFNVEMPAPPDGLLDELSGRIGDATITFTIPKSSGRKFTESGTWGSRMTAIFNLRGQVSRRGIADAMRDALVTDDRYSIQTQGADVPDRFDWVVTTTLHDPDAGKPTEGVRP